MNIKNNNNALLTQKKETKSLKKELSNEYKTVHIAIFGKGLVGGTLINQIIENKSTILERKKIVLHVFAVVNSKKALLALDGISKDWENNLLISKTYINAVEEVVDFAKKNKLENLIAVDNTADKSFVENYETLISEGFNLVSSNKIANTLSFDFYKNIRQKLKDYSKQYLYETNVGAGLPLIDTIRLLHDSGENITKIKGVFSGSLSFLFNQFSANKLSFSEVLKEAIAKGFTEPDPREDLGGNDVARKLLILARELDLENELEDVVVQNLIPKNLREGTASEFLKNLELLDQEYQSIKENQKPNYVLRYVGELGGDLFQQKGDLKVSLVSVPQNTPLGSLQGSDAIFEIYTESYGEQPIVIQGAGAGAKVTARGVLGDILRLAKHNNK